MIDRCKMATGYFSDGYNCGQAVFLAFHDLLEMDKAQAARLSNCLGGGFSQTGGLCGAVSGASLILSGLYGREDESREGESKQRQENTYRMVRALFSRFKEEYGNVSCPALLKRGLEDSGTLRNPKFHCGEYVGLAAKTVLELIEAGKGQSAE